MPTEKINIGGKYNKVFGLLAYYLVVEFSAFCKIMTLQWLYSKMIYKERKING